MSDLNLQALREIAPTWTTFLAQLTPFEGRYFTVEERESGLWMVATRDRSGAPVGFYVTAGWAAMCKTLAEEMAATLNQWAGAIVRVDA